jgi:hypothetical protein
LIFYLPLYFRGSQKQNFFQKNVSPTSKNGPFVYFLLSLFVIAAILHQFFHNFVIILQKKVPFLEGEWKHFFWKRTCEHLARAVRTCPEVRWPEILWNRNGGKKNRRGRFFLCTRLAWVLRDDLFASCFLRAHRPVLLNNNTDNIIQRDRVWSLELEFGVWCLEMHF